jgi:RNA polymerase sigma-70 factor (ECF subfamily)
MPILALAGHEVLVGCHVAAEAARWDVSVDTFGAALETSAARAFLGRTPTSAEVTRYLESLHLSDLALACACADGHDRAWTHFVATHQPTLRRAADAMDPSGNARELADALYGELFGVREEDGQRRSLFRYFHGRSTLSTWLRTVLAQRLVDRARSRRREDPLPDDDVGAGSGSHGAQAAPERPRWIAAVQQALRRAFEALPSRDRLRVSLYHGQSLTLAEIGRMLGEHEATVSRHLTRTRRDVRKAVEAELTELGLDERARREAFESLADDPGPLDVADLLDQKPERKVAPADRSTTEDPAGA